MVSPMRTREIEQRIDWLYAEARKEACDPVSLWARALDALRGIETLPEPERSGYLYALKRWTTDMYYRRLVRPPEAARFLAAFCAYLERED